MKMKAKTKLFTQDIGGLSRNLYMKADHFIIASNDNNLSTISILSVSSLLRMIMIYQQFQHYPLCTWYSYMYKDRHSDVTLNYLCQKNCSKSNWVR